ncbi:MAG: hypothetical protein K1W38_04490 [Lachnospiraceae bacterium]
MQGQPLYYKMVAKAVVSNADRIISAIDGFIAKADEELSETLEAEGFAEPEETVNAINIMQEKIADILQSQTEELIAVLIAAGGWDEARKKISAMLGMDDIAQRVEEAAMDMLDVEVPNLAAAYIKETEADMVIDTLRWRTSDWMTSYSSQLGEWMKVSTHKQLTDLIQNAIDNGESIEKLTRKIMDGGWRTEYYQARRVALTEVLRAHAVAHEESIQQSPATDRKEWVHTGAHKNDPRQNHIDMSGQIVLKNQPFTLHSVNGGTYYPMHPLDIILPACESVNCHCIHRGITNDEILGMSYEDRKRMQQEIIENDNGAWEKELDAKNKAKSGIKSKEKEGSKPKYDYAASKIDRKQIASAEYQNKFNALGENKRVTRSIRANAKKMLRHRSGTEYEDLVYINSKTGAVMVRDDYNVARQVNASKAMKKMVKDAEEYTIIAIHNHPGSSVPSLSDIIVAQERKYKYGIVACHDGSIYKYGVSGEVNKAVTNGGLDLLERVKYTCNEQERSTLMERALSTLKDGGVDMEVL